MADDEYLLQGWFPFESAWVGTVEWVAALLDLPTWRDDEGYPSVTSDALAVHAWIPDQDEIDREREQFGFDINLNLIFVHSGLGEGENTPLAMQRILRTAVALAELPGMRGRLGECYNLRRPALRSEDGQITLDPDWEGWSSWPELLALVPEPHEFAHLPRPS